MVIMMMSDLLISGMGAAAMLLKKAVMRHLALQSKIAFTLDQLIPRHHVELHHLRGRYFHRSLPHFVCLNRPSKRLAGPFLGETNGLVVLSQGMEGGLREDQ